LKTIEISKTSQPFTHVIVKYCDTFLSKLIGLMFSRELKIDHGIILVENSETRINTSIHMLFMNYDITVLWVDKQLVIVDKVLARKWRPMYLPKKPAQYVVELHQSKFSEFSIGDQLIFFS
jgi:uncharacterized membrane protein (UPF0127 family)